MRHEPYLKPLPKMLQIPPAHKPPVKLSGFAASILAIAALCPVLAPSAVFAQTNTTPTPEPVSLSPVVTLTAADKDKIQQELTQLIKDLDAAASKRDLETVMGFYSPSFRHGDGLNKEEYGKILGSLWQRYNQIQYSSRLIKWEMKDGQLIAEVATDVQGTKSKDNDDFTLSASLTTRQTYAKAEGSGRSSWQIVNQEILTENSSLTTGETPPPVKLRVPTIIGVGRQYVLDAIVTEPVGNGILLGATLDRPVNANNYNRDETIDLAPLRAGGVFKIGQAPFRAGDRWVSVVIVRQNGVTIASQRMKVSRTIVGNQYIPSPELPTNRRRRPGTPDRQTIMPQRFDRQLAVMLR